MEEPVEPFKSECRVRVFDGAKVLDRVLGDLKMAIYEYNSRIKYTGFYLKPVHKVYKSPGGVRRVYEYYGRYWWRITRKGGKVRFEYVGASKPAKVEEPPDNPLEGLVVVREGEDVIVECSVYERFKTFFEGLKTSSEPV
ncbi:MAG: hypothetical protein P3X22_001995 [Thermoprotei archaeon]|nr:hypothetical protein [Thermoprotei archaeon]